MSDTAVVLQTPVEGLEAIEELVQQTHWIKDNYEETHCPMLDAEGKHVHIGGEPLYKAGFCLAGLINKQAGLEAGHMTGSMLIRDSLGGMWFDSDEGRARCELAQAMGRPVFEAIKQHPTYNPREHDGIENWNDSDGTNREIVVEVVRTAIHLVKNAD